MRRCLPAFGIDVLLYGYSQRMYGMHFSRRGQQNHFLIADAVNRFNVIDLGDAHGNRPGLIEDDRIDIG